jgi:hypothetical protein
MAGSLSHITEDDGSFRMDLIENMRDAREALEECHQIIAYLLPYAGQGMGGGDATGALAQAVHDLGFPESHTPVMDTELMGPEGGIRRGAGAR